MNDLSEEILAYALQNAMSFGKADASKVLPKLFQHGFKKESIKAIMPAINKAVKKVNGMDGDERAAAFEKLKSCVKVHERASERILTELPNASEKMVFRLAPFPSGALHIGNAKTYLLNALYAERYKAKTLLVMDDTIGSEEKQLAPEAYDLIKDGFLWLDVAYDKKIVYKSDRLKLYYSYAEKLIEKDKVYVCYCPAEELRKNRASGVECSCRQFPVKIQTGRWKEMFKEKEGHAVLRIKTDMQHPNPAFRDRVLFKISDREHPRIGNKYRVWPSLEMSWAIDDYELGVTHIIRGNDLMIETEMEKYIWDIFGWKHATTIHTGLVRIEGLGAKISKSKAQKEVKSGEFIGWDDPRSWSLQSLRRRGILPQAVREFVREIGLNKQDIAVPIETLYAINRRMIDFEARRFYFVENPVKIKLDGKLPESVGLPVHPERDEKRIVHLKPEIYVTMNDFEKLRGKEVRLLHMCNVKLDERARITSIDDLKPIKIHWVSEGVKARILMPDGRWAEGLVEKAASKLNKGTVVQFERFGFVRYDRTHHDIIEFWFAHG